ncbi:hypothetical protein [Pseudonocardia sp. N23]|uniref:hypothetical protein n=1 Tax=Pseudonocardia sp. N23 TaxID=1987376 RepID=UPI0011455928|nr:hypothetical protein [Pseudonocardia sp. N23]
MTRADIATNPRTIARRATAASRERRADKVTPGWWVFSHGPSLVGSWTEVITTTRYRDGNRPMVRMTVTDPGTGRSATVETPAGSPAWSLTPAEARRAGLA